MGSMPYATLLQNSHGIEGVLKWAKTWHADAIIGRFDNDDNVELFRETELSRWPRIINQGSAIFQTSPAITARPAEWQQSFF